MRSQRYDVFLIDRETLGSVAVTYEDENTTFTVEAVEDSEYEYTYTCIRERFGRDEDEGHLFVIPHPTSEDEVFILLGYGMRSMVDDVISRVFFEEVRDLDPAAYQYELSSEEQWGLMEYDNNAMLNVAHIEHPTYGTDELWDMAEEVAMHSRKDFDTVMSELREEVLEERYPIEMVEVSIEKAGGSLTYEAPARFHPRPIDGDDQFTDETAHSLVEVLRELREADAEQATP